MTYPGGKNGSGVYQRIINNMPPHKVFIEACCGSGAVIRNKRPAQRNIAIDLSQTALDLTAELAGDRLDIEYIRTDAIKLLSSNFLDEVDEDTLVYFDPPYLPETRKGGDLYEHEMTVEDHERLLRCIKRLGCMVMISGYRSGLYDFELRSWYCINYRTQTRRGMVDESLLMNFEPPNELHDYSFLGSNFRDRERIKRKKQRWKTKIENMDRLERLAIMEALQNV